MKSQSVVHQIIASLDLLSISLNLKLGKLGRETV